MSEEDAREFKKQLCNWSAICLSLHSHLRQKSVGPTKEIIVSCSLSNAKGSMTLNTCCLCLWPSWSLGLPWGYTTAPFCSCQDACQVFSKLTWHSWEQPCWVMPWGSGHWNIFLTSVCGWRGRRYKDRKCIAGIWPLWKGLSYVAYFSFGLYEGSLTFNSENICPWSIKMLGTFTVQSLTICFRDELDNWILSTPCVAGGAAAEAQDLSLTHMNLPENYNLEDCLGIQNISFNPAFKMRSSIYCSCFYGFLLVPECCFFSSSYPGMF